MSDQADPSKPRSGGQAREQRKDRLKLALRENLKRRKAQVRGRSQEADKSDRSPDPEFGVLRKDSEA